MHYTCNPDAWQKNKKYIGLDSYEMYYICNGLSHLTHKTQLTCVCVRGRHRFGEGVDVSHFALAEKVSALIF
jgi:hypothetical protein